MGFAHILLAEYKKLREDAGKNGIVGTTNPAITDNGDMNVYASGSCEIELPENSIYFDFDKFLGEMRSCEKFPDIRDPEMKFYRHKKPITTTIENPDACELYVTDFFETGYLVMIPPETPEKTTIHIFAHDNMRPVAKITRDLNNDRYPFHIFLFDCDDASWDMKTLMNIPFQTPEVRSGASTDTPATASLK
ncbi:MAG: hypothetical protein ABIA21_01725 [Candidatus Aenigmatarchaeota archaeon]